MMQYSRWCGILGGAVLLAMSTRGSGWLSTLKNRLQRKFRHWVKSIQGKVKLLVVKYLRQKKYRRQGKGVGGEVFEAMSTRGSGGLVGLSMVAWLQWLYYYPVCKLLGWLVLLFNFSLVCEVLGWGKYGWLSSIRRSTCHLTSTYTPMLCPFNFNVVPL